jgi:hypothetical protein
MSPESVLSDYPPEISLECFLLLCCQSLEEVFPYPHTPSSYAPFCTPSPYALFCIPLDIVFPELRNKFVWTQFRSPSLYALFSFIQI